MIIDIKDGQRAAATQGGLSPEVQRERCNAAVGKARKFLSGAEQKIDTERLKFLLEAYAEHGTEPIILVRARAFAHILQNKTLYIDDNPIAGTIASFPCGVYAYPEWSSDWILKDMNQTIISHLGKINISDEDKKIIRESAAFFKNRSVEFRTNVLSRELHGYDPTDDIKSGLFYTGAHNSLGAGNANYGPFVHRGLNAIIAETEARLLNLEVNTETRDQINFYRAALISLRALIDLAGRYADLAEKMAEETEDSIRRAELLEMAEACRNVPANPPRSFREAVQSWWFLHLGIQIEEGGCGSSPGRLGQYLERFYQKDKARGLAREDALAWIKCLYMKILEYGYYQGLAYSRLTSGHTGHTINVGGLDRDGHDATAELDYLLLDAQIELRNIQPTLTVLYHDDLKEDFLLKAVELEKTGLGQPQWMNVRVIIERLLSRYAANGITIEDARSCVNMSCVGTGVAGRTTFIRENTTFNVAKCMELALHDGIDPAIGKRIGPATGDPRAFASFEDVFEAFAEQLRHMFRKLRPYGSLAKKVSCDTVPNAFRSAMWGGCLERGKSEYEGGADFNLYFCISTAAVDAANSLAAVQNLVFETKKISMDQLLEALKANFEGHGEIHGLCMGAPKHGNGDPAMDALMRRVYDTIYDAFQAGGSSYFKGHKACLEAYSLSIHNYFGMLTGALPSGHLRGKPLTDASVSATPGTDRNGPLQLIRSAAKALDTVRYGSNHFNMKFHPSAISDKTGARKMISLIKAYMDAGGSHIQFNVVSAETLRKAMEVPRDYQDLTVRVAGFSAYFTRLHEGVQNEIIARTEHQL